MSIAKSISYSALIAHNIQVIFTKILVTTAIYVTSGINAKTYD